MNLSGFIARRYLFAKKSHNVINIISGISAAGIATGCAALVIVLSIYNGFDSIVQGLYNACSPDIVIEPKEGKTFSPDAAQMEALRAETGVRAVCEVVEENIYLTYGSRQAIATAQGVDSTFTAVTELRNHLTEGTFNLQEGENNQVVMGRMLAYNLGLRTSFITPLEAWFPARGANVSLMDPMASLNKVRLFPAGILMLDNAFDRKYIFLPLKAMQNLLGCPGEVSRLEVYATPEALDAQGFATASLVDATRRHFGDGFTCKTRREQNDTLYKLISSEKLAIYLILVLMMIIISFNILGSLKMLIIEKTGDVEIMRAMGAGEGLIRRIFIKEGWYISLFGIAAGVIIGLAVCVIQQQFGIVRMPGNFVVDYYPVVIRLSDILLIVGGVALIGYIIALIPRPTRKPENATVSRRLQA